MKKTNSGITHILAIVVVMIVVAALLAIFLSMQTGGLSSLYPTYPVETPEALPTPSPISDSDDISTLEEEFNATVTGSVDADINSMESEASGL